MALTTNSVGGGNADDKDNKPKDGKGKATDDRAGENAAARGVHPNQRTSDDLPDDERIDRKATASRHHGIDEEAARNDPGKMPEPIAAPGATDPHVLQALGEQQVAVQNRDAEGIRESNEKLRRLGYK